MFDLHRWQNQHWHIERLVALAAHLHEIVLRDDVMDVDRAFEEVDILLSPTTPLTAWRQGEWTVSIGGADESVLAASWRLTYPFNLTGLPAISVPCGFDRPADRAAAGGAPL